MTKGKTGYTWFEYLNLGVMQFSGKLPSDRFTKGSGITLKGLQTHTYEDEIMVILTSAIVGLNI